LEYVLNNFEAIAGAILALILVIYAIITRQWWILRAAAYKFMLDAERIMKTKEGKAKMDAVYAAVWAQVPKWLKRFVTEKTLREKLQELYDKAKDSLSEQWERNV
jgi:hypothetical protein